jgi:hypothetical protein
MNTFELEKQEYPLLIEGTLRHQNNINIAKTKYGNTFHCKIINTNYFGDNTVIPTIVVSDDISLVLGKPRYPENFKDDDLYKIKLVDRNNCGLYSIEVLERDLQWEKGDNDNITRENIKQKIIKEIKNAIDTKVNKCVETKINNNDDKKEQFMELIKFLNSLRPTCHIHKAPNFREQVEICYIDNKIVGLHKMLKILNK